MEIGKTGYETSTVKIEKTISAVVAGNLLLMGSVAWIAVDVLTGATFRLKPEKVAVALKPKDLSPPKSFQKEFDPKSVTDPPTTISAATPEEKMPVSKQYF